MEIYFKRNTLIYSSKNIFMILGKLFFLKKSKKGLMETYFKRNKLIYPSKNIFIIINLYFRKFIFLNKKFKRVNGNLF